MIAHLFRCSLRRTNTPLCNEEYWFFDGPSR
jgi:hypothetical protein